MRFLRWECVPLLRPFETPGAGALGTPIASGLIGRDDATNAPSSPITLPDAPDNAPFLLLRLEALGPTGWIVAVGARGSTPDPGDGTMRAIDPVPVILVPRPGAAETFRSIEVRAVKPGSVFVARTWE